MAPAELHHLFDTQAAQYASFRPRYPARLYEMLYAYARGPKDLAVDVACGSGQCATVLAQEYTSVVGVDPNNNQLASAEQAYNVTYKVGSAEDLRSLLADGSVDLLTVAQALHWFDLDRFYKEVQLVLKPGATFAAWGYDLNYFPGHGQADSILLKLYNETLGPYWDDRRHLIEQHYAGMEPPSEGFCDMTHHTIDMPAELSIDSYMGYLSTWSAHATYRREHPDRPDPLVKFRAELKEALGLSNDSDTVAIAWPAFIVLARAKLSQQCVA